jgi:hypothetical protein
MGAIKDIEKPDSLANYNIGFSKWRLSFEHNKVIL